MTVERVSLYRAPTTVADADGIADWLCERVDAEVEIRSRFLDRHADDVPDRRPGPDRTSSDRDLAREFARARVLSPYDRETGNEMLGVVRYEERAQESPDRAGGVLYDGLAIQHVLNERLAPDERDLSHLHVVLLDRALGTWGGDGRWHKRVNVLGQPALVSVPGLYEAPAKPEAYYAEKQRHALLTGDAPPREVLENEVEGEFLVEDDPRTTDALCGYVLQAYHYLETGEAFCDDERCRLFNAHRQEALVGAQLRGAEFCPTHAASYET